MGAGWASLEARLRYGKGSREHVAARAEVERLKAVWLRSLEEDEVMTKKTDWALVDRLDRYGAKAEARMQGVLRGGHVLDGRFYAFVGGVGLLSAPVAEVTDMRATGDRPICENCCGEPAATDTDVGKTVFLRYCHQCMAVIYPGA